MPSGKRILNDRNKHNDYTSLCYELEIAQAPVLGQVLRDNRCFSGPMIDTIWDADDHCFYTRVLDETPHLRSSEEFSHDWQVDNYKQMGWVDYPRKLHRVE